jgi:hypothetical protein
MNNHSLDQKGEAELLCPVEATFAHGSSQATRVYWLTA